MSTFNDQKVLNAILNPNTPFDLTTSAATAAADDDNKSSKTSIIQLHKKFLIRLIVNQN
jgi:hypothetical protein